MENNGYSESPEYRERTGGWNLALYFKLVVLVFPVAVWEVTNTDITSLQARRPGIAVGKQARVQEEISQRIEWGSRKLTTVNAFFVVSFSPRLPWCMKVLL